MICTAKLAPFGGTLILAATFAAHATDVATSPRESPANPAHATRTLDLKPPQITRIFTAQQIDMILARATDPALEHVEVEAPRIGDLPLRDNSASTLEVAFKEVIRWLAPYPTVLAARVNAAPDATDPYRPVPVSLSSYHASFAPPYNQR
jgi:hypothetical protein